MAGHSHVKNIMFRKGKQDKERSKLFSKLAREITVAAKAGLPDPAHNARLRTAIVAAKAESMPKDNIERAVKKAGGSDAENYDEIRYEGRSPGGVALIVETMTDNRNRTSADVRAAFSKYGGAMGETGAAAGRPGRPTPRLRRAGVAPRHRRAARRERRGSVVERTRCRCIRPV